MCCSVATSSHARCMRLWPSSSSRRAVNCSRCTGTTVIRFIDALRCVAVCCSVLQCVAVCCSVLQCVAVCCSVLQCIIVFCSMLQCVAVCCSMLQCVAVCCSVLQHVAVRCRVLQCVAECCSVELFRMLQGSFAHYRPLFAYRGALLHITGLFYRWYRALLQLW